MFGFHLCSKGAGPPTENRHLDANAGRLVSSPLSSSPPRYPRAHRRADVPDMVWWARRRRDVRKTGCNPLSARQRGFLAILWCGVPGVWQRSRVAVIRDDRARQDRHAGRLRLPCRPPATVVLSHGRVRGRESQTAHLQGKEA